VTLTTTSGLSAKQKGVPYHSFPRDMEDHGQLNAFVVVHPRFFNASRSSLHSRPTRP
jgi:hypothetical protein